MNNLSMRGKFILLLVSIMAIFVVSLFLIRGAGTQIAHSFNSFYNEDFRIIMDFERVKEAQIDRMLSIRALQIGYLLNLADQIKLSNQNLEKNQELTPSLNGRAGNSLCG